ncbi:MAG: GNAT family N-acetyltransferase [Coprobacter sp.]|nr:GNAT family N-acetyltransferase [Coprobacter sp.]
MNTPIITPAGHSEIPIIRAMAGVVFYDTYRLILSPEQLDYMYDMMYAEESLQRQIDSGHRFFIAYVDDIPAGFVSIERQSERLVHLQKLYVMPAYQHAHIGRRLIERAFDEARALTTDGHCRVELNVNRQNEALDFYTHIGMRIASSGDFAIGNGYYMNDYIMAIDL